MVGMNFFAEQNHLSERGRAMSFANADALGRPRRSVLPLCVPGSEAFERFLAGTVKCCEVRVMKAYLLPLLFGCLGVIMGFALRDAFLVPSVSLEQVPAFLQSASQGQVPTSVPAQEERYAVTIVNPTFPPQVKGEWDPLKIAAEEMSQGKTGGTNSLLR